MKPKKVVIVQPIVEEGVKVLKDAGFEVVIPENTDQETLLREFRDADGVLARTAPLNRELIANAPNLKIIVRAGVGVDNIDVKAATDHRVSVCNVPTANTNSVAEHTIGMMIGIAHQIYKTDKLLRAGDFESRNVYTGTELKGKTVGIIGLGNIGRTVAKKCVYGLEMNVIGYDPFVKSVEGIDHFRIVDSIDSILEEADFVSLHLPYLKDMHHFINLDSFKKMKKSAYFINCARGGLVDEEALYTALKEGEIAGAALDVFEEEPTPPFHPLWELENIIVTPHNAALTKEAIIGMQAGAAEEIVRVLKGEAPRFQLNSF